MSESTEPAPSPELSPQPSDAPPVASLEAAPAGGAPGPAPIELAIERARPSFVFFGVVSALSLIADVASKAWAEIVLSQRTLLDPAIVIVKNHLMFSLAYNKGGAWGLLQTASETVRKPFFLLVSVLAIGFIVSLYGRLSPAQRALKWGLPMVLGGALGNLSDRVTRSSVIDFIDYRAGWIESMNALIARLYKTWSVTDHWPTFNVADICICIGVGLMAVDMITSRRRPPAPKELAPIEPEPAKEPEKPVVTEPAKQPETAPPV